MAPQLTLRAGSQLHTDMYQFVTLRILFTISSDLSVPISIYFLNDFLYTVPRSDRRATIQCCTALFIQSSDLSVQYQYVCLRIILIKSPDRRLQYQHICFGDSVYEVSRSEPPISTHFLKVSLYTVSRSEPAVSSHFLRYFSVKCLQIRASSINTFP